MDVKIAITQANDEVAIMSYLIVGRGNILPFGATWADKDKAQWMREPTPENIEHEISRAEFLSKPIKSWRIISSSDVPVDRTYRNALRDTGTKLDWDMEAARNLHRDKIRHARAKVFLKLDGEWMKAMGKGNKEEANAIDSIRQKFRDMPQDSAIDAAKNIDELKLIWDSEFGEM